MNPTITDLKDVKCIELKANGRKLFVAVSNDENLCEQNGGFSPLDDIEIIAGLPMYESHYDIDELKLSIFAALKKRVCID